MKEQNQNESTVDVELLKSQLLHRKITIGRFRLPYSYEQTKDMLLAAYQAEVEYRCRMCGNGKTTWLKAIRTLINSLNLRHPQTNSSYSVSLWNARELAYRCKDEYQEWARIARLPILAIDDFGTDPKEIISFGNCLTPMIDLITKRYEEQLFTLFTTNLTFSQIKEKYEERIADRLIEMVVPIRFGNGSYRS